MATYFARSATMGWIPSSCRSLIVQDVERVKRQQAILVHSNFAVPGSCSPDIYASVSRIPDLLNELVPGLSRCHWLCIHPPVPH
jgi:hypothetical protein